MASGWQNIVAVMREVKRVLRDDGTCWLNLGDAYASGTKGTGGNSPKQNSHPGSFSPEPIRIDMEGLASKQLMGQPWRVAFALQDDGWILRSAIVWHKPNPMPESVRDRPTNAYEMVFLLAKSGKYFYDAEAVREKSAYDWQAHNTKYDYTTKPVAERNDDGKRPTSGNGTGANARNVWTIPTQGRPDAHFATYPDELPRRCILAGTSERGVCADCGAPWGRQTEKSVTHESGSGKADPGNEPHGKHSGSAQSESGSYDIRTGAGSAYPNPRLATHLRLQRGHRPGHGARPLRWQRHHAGRSAGPGAQVRGAGPEPRVPGDCQEIHQPGGRDHSPDGPRMTEALRPFQRKFLKGALAPGVSTAAMSMPRGNGKTWLAAHILTRCLTPGDALHVAGAEYLLCAASLEQARLCFRFIRAALEIDDPDAYQPFRFLDSHTRIGIAHKATNTRLRVLSSNGKTAMGIVGCPLLVADEPGAWEVNGGQLMADAIDTAQGKPGSPMRVIYIGTLAPASDGWWHDLIQGGSRASTYVQMLRGGRDTWDSWQTIRKANPLTAISPEFRAKLREERDAARSDTRLKARFLSYRLNVPTGDEAKMLLDCVGMGAGDGPASS